MLGVYLGMTLGNSSYGVSDETRFIMTVATTTPSETFTLPLNGQTVNFDWETSDGQSGTKTGTTDLVITFAVADTHTIYIGGTNNTLPQIRFNNAGDRLKVQSIENWGDIAWTNFGVAFYGCTNLVHNASDAPDLSGVTNMSGAFRGCSVGSIGVGWDVTTISNFSFTFLDSGVTSIGWTDMSGATDCYEMCRNTASLTSVGAFTISNLCTRTRGMFRNSALTTIDVSNYDTSNVTDMMDMFRNASGLNPDISSFDVSSVTTATHMLEGTAFTQANYDLALVAFDALPVQSGVGIHFGEAVYSAGGAETSRDNLILDHSWIITDGGPASNGNEWVGTTADASLGSNWSLGTTPGASDVAVFDSNNTACTMNITLACDVYLSSDYTQTVAVSNGTGYNGQSKLFYQTGGTWNASPDVTASHRYGDLLIYGGTYSSAADVTVERTNGYFRILSGATFTHNNGTVEFTGSGVTCDVNGKTLYNLTLNPSNNLVQSPVLSNADVANKLYIQGGGLDGSGVVVTVQGDVQTGTNSSTNNADVQVELNGTGAQEVYNNKAGGSGKLPRIRINKSAGTATFFDTLVLKNDSGVAAWVYTAGTVDMTTNTATIEFNGFAHTFADSTTTFYNLTVNHFNVATACTIGANLTVNNILRVDSRVAWAGYTITAATLDINAGVQDSLPGTTFVVSGNCTIDTVTMDGVSAKWDLHVSGTNTAASNTSIGYCDASGFTALTATGATDLGNNTNVTF